jgi:hypothetical protein
MPVIIVMMFAFIDSPTIHGRSATAIIPDRTARGGDPYARLSQNSGCGIKL